MTPVRVEQVFLERKPGGVEALLVLEDEAGARTRERLLLPAEEHRDAVGILARQLTYRGLSAARKLRLRVSRAGALSDDTELLSLLLAAMAAETG